ncbi:MAG TPA: PAS domain S-box protein [Syntrophorhabdaceae bacterium]|nr:PAS domain S-box protein [Syntrophorhabdaceae bacterium]
MMSSEYFKAIIDCIGDPVFVKDQQCRYVFLNDEAHEMFGTSFEQWPGKTDYDIFPKEQADVFRAHDNRVLETGERVVNEEQITDGQGNIRNIITKKMLLINNEGEKFIIGTSRDVTDRKRAEEALKKNEEKYRLLADNAADVIFTLGLDMIIKYISPSVERLSGFTPEELIGQPISKSVTAASMELFRMAIQEEMEIERTGESDPNRSRTLEVEMLRKDGSTLWTEVKASALRNNHGVASGVLGMTRDITKRKEAEEILRISKLQLSQAMGLANIVYWETDPTDDTFIFNDAFYALYGTTAEREGGYRMTRQEYKERFVHPDDLPHVLPVAESNATRRVPGSLTDIEHRIVRRDGEVRYILARAEVLGDGSGQFIKRYGANQDITRRKQAEEALKIAHQQLIDIIAFLPDATFVIDSEKKVLAWNRACEEMTGIKKEEIIGEGDYAYSVPFYGERRPILVDYVTMDLPELEQRYVSIRKEGNVLHAESFTPAVYNGKGAHLSCESSPLFDRTGKVAGAIESIRDISEFKRLETQLRQSHKLEALGTLAGGIAHDFNNILTALLGYGTLLKMAIKEGTLNEYVNQILSASQKAVDLVQSILAFSRQQKISLKPVSLHNIIKGTENLLKRLLTEDIVIKTCFAANDPIIMADSTQIDQILFNLATNSRDAMPQGGALTIETQVVDLDYEFRRLHGYGKPGRYALLSISDTGVGIDAAAQERIFDPFFTTKETGKGTGLGLSTVYGIVKQHNGYITVYSEPNMGTTFNIYIPTVKEIPKEETPMPAAVAGGREIILIGEDSTPVRNLMCSMLAKHGYTTIEAVDGQDVVEQFKRADTVDLLILDSVMPKISGRTAYNEIQRIKPDVRVIFMSGYTKDVLLDKGIEEEKFSFLQKPFSASALLQKVREVLDNMPDPRLSCN